MNIITRNHERYFYETVSWGSVISYRYLYKLGDIQVYVIVQEDKAEPDRLPEVRCHVKVPRLGARMLFDINLGTVDYTTFTPPHEKLPTHPPALGEIPNEHRDQLMQTVLACLDTLDKYELPTGHMEMIRKTLDEYHHHA